MMIHGKSQDIIVKAFGEQDGKPTTEVIIEILMHEEILPLINSDLKMAECIISRIGIQLALQNYKLEE